MEIKSSKSIGEVTFESTDKALNEGFNWAKHQALAYVHNGEDPVGLWYEASLPGRDAFCMRDVAHQSIGAAVLGLQDHNYNMFRKFAENISVTRDWCSYWEINKDNLPAPVDYKGDNEFWYNLPANFDILQACYQQYLWTGNTDYLKNPLFLEFYKRTVEDYVETWDRDDDGLIEHQPNDGIRGIASYNEVGMKPLMGGDLIAAQYAGYMAYAKLCLLKGQEREYSTYKKKAENIQKTYLQDWWDHRNQRFYGALLERGKFLDEYYMEGNFLPIYFEIIDDSKKLNLALKDLIKNGVPNIEAKSHLPEIYFGNGRIQQAYDELLALCDPSIPRREYPEVSYSVIGAIARGMMGVKGDGLKTIVTKSQLPSNVKEAHIDHLPILGRTISVLHFNNQKTVLKLESGSPIKWKAVFMTEAEEFLLNGNPIKVEYEKDQFERNWAYVTTVLEPNEECIIEF